MARALLIWRDVRRFVAIACLTISGIASAQSARPAMSDGDELPKGSWPGVGLEDLRGLPECSLEDPAPRIGEPITCRPPVLPSRAHYSLAIGWSTGLVESDGDLRGGHALVLTADWWLTRSLGIGAHGAFAGLGTMSGTAIANEALGIVRWRQFTDEVDRDAFAFAIGAGYAWREMQLGGAGAIARATISRDVGWMFGESSALVWSWELAVQQDLGELGYRTIMAGVRTGIERGIREPRNLAERDSDPPFRSAIAGDFRGGPQGVGFGAGLDVTFGARWSWRTTAFWTSHDAGDGQSGVRANWGVETGPRLALATGTLEPYLEAQGGPALLGGEVIGALAEAEVGLGVPLFCQSRLDFGFRVQARVDDGFDPSALFGVLRVAHGTALRRSSSDCTPDTPFAR
ncbi:MAG: hypothetical protein AB7T06_14195 [Kofleriaceae bacterium]